MSSVQELLNRLVREVPMGAGHLQNITEIGQRVQRATETLTFIDINAEAGELSAKGCAIQARVALKQLTGERL